MDKINTSESWILNRNQELESKVKHLERRIEDLLKATEHIRFEREVKIQNTFQKTKNIAIGQSPNKGDFLTKNINAE